MAKFYNIIRHSYNTMQNSPDYGRSHGAIFSYFLQDVFMKFVVAIIDD